MNRIRVITLLLSLLPVSFMRAQELTVKSFGLAQSEIISGKDKRNDLTGQPCALLKIQMVDQLEKVEGNVMGNIVDRGTEKWVYVTDGTYQLRIHPKNHLPIDFKTTDYGVNGMESNRVYVLRLVGDTNKAGAGSEHAYLKLKISPETAVVTIDGQQLDDEPEDGWINPLLKYGQHVIEIRARGYVTHTETIDIQSEAQREIVLQRQSNPTVTIRSATPDAKIYVNNVERGRGECTLELFPRDYMVKVVKEGYETLERPITVTEKESQLFPMPALKELVGYLNVNFKPTGSELIIDGKSHGTTPTIVSQLSAGTHSVMVKKEGYNPYINNTVKIEANKENTLFGKLEKESEQKTIVVLLPATGGYVSASVQVGTLMGAGISAGGYFNNFNVEAFYLLGLAKSEDIYWNKSGAASIMCSYKPTAFGLRLGYGFLAMDALRLTPQVGATIVSIKCSDGDSKGNATAATLGLRADYAVAPHFALFAAPEVSFAVSKSDVYGQLMDVSSKIKSWATGFNVRLGLSVTF